MKGKVNVRSCCNGGKPATVRFAVSSRNVIAFLLLVFMAYSYSIILCTRGPKISTRVTTIRRKENLDCTSPRDRYAYLRVARPRSFHLCLRTKNADQHLSELLSYYFYHGVTGISLYDDSDNNNTRRVVSKFQRAGFQIKYHYVKSEAPRKNENSELLDCYLENFIANDFIMNVDDDEFFFPAENNHPGYRIIDALQEAKTACISLPIYFFGTSGVQRLNPGDNTITSFVRRDSDMSEKDYSVLKSTNELRNRTTLPLAFYMYKHKKSRTKRLRIQKAIFSPAFMEDKEDFLKRLTANYKAGSLIHGYKMSCKIEDHPPLAVAHYTRSETDLHIRVSTFWKTTIGLRRRFSTDERKETYLLARDRNAQRDERLTKFGNCLRLFREVNNV